VVTDIFNVFDTDTTCEGDSAKRDKFFAITRESEQVNIKQAAVEPLTNF
jgi:hypothetical protein